jgi:hypothetical protein
MCGKCVSPPEVCFLFKSSLLENAEHVPERAVDIDQINSLERNPAVGPSLQRRGIAAFEVPQIILVNETRTNFRPYIAEKQVLDLFYYAWLDSREGFAVYRCDHLTQTGRLALAPF